MDLTLDIALVALLVMMLGEAWRVPAPGLVRDAPLAQATAVALATATSWPLPGTGGGNGPLAPFLGLAGPLALALVATLVVGVVRRHWRDLPGDLGRSLVSVVLTGVLARLPLPTGRTLHEQVEEPGANAGIVAFLLLLVTATTVAAPVLGRSVLRRRDHTPLRSQVLADVRRHGLLALATATTAAVMALALPVLHAITFLLFLVPMAVLMPAVTRQREIRAAQRQTMFALARLTDQAGLTAPGHASRVARLAVPVAREAGVEDADLADVETAALLHDVGQVALSRPIPSGATIEVSGLDQRRVAAAGAAILARTAELSRLSPVVADVGIAHHRAVVRGDVALASRVVRVVSAYDDLTGGGTRLTGALAPTEALERILRSTPHEYDPVVVAALVRHLERSGSITGSKVAGLRELRSQERAGT